LVTAGLHNWMSKPSYKLLATWRWAIPPAVITFIVAWLIDQQATFPARKSPDLKTRLYTSAGLALVLTLFTLSIFLDQNMERNRLLLFLLPAFSLGATIGAFCNFSHYVKEVPGGKVTDTRTRL
jgi:putative flippase GtrA